MKFEFHNRRQNIRKPLFDDLQKLIKIYGTRRSQSYQQTRFSAIRLKYTEPKVSIFPRHSREKIRVEQGSL